LVRCLSEVKPSYAAIKGVHIAIWLISTIIVAAAILALGLSTGVKEVTENLAAHIAFAIIVIVAVLVAWTGGKSEITPPSSGEGK